MGEQRWSSLIYEDPPPPPPRFHGVTNDHEAEEIIALNGSSVGGYRMVWDAYTFTEPQPL